MHSKAVLRQLSLQVFISTVALRAVAHRGADNQHQGVPELHNAVSLPRFEEHTNLGFSSFASACLYPANLASILQQALNC